MDRGRGSDPNRPVEPDEARARGNDPDAVERRDGGAEDGPRRVGEVREEREGARPEGTAGTEGHAGDREAGRGEVATELPDRWLPAVRYRDLPDPEPLRKYIGASVILLATALGSGELLIWPYITTQAGVGLLWLAFVGFTAQYFLNMEIERYTLATGETAVTGFTRMWKWWGVVFILLAILPNTFPGWATSAATMFTYLLGINESSYTIIATIALIAIALAVTLSPVIYNTLEKVEGVLVAIILVFMVVAIIVATEASSWTGIVTEAPAGAANLPRYIGEIGVAAIFGAVVFAGAGGCNNLVQSNYIRDKGMGMGKHIPRIVSPITGEEEAAPSLGYIFRTDEANMRRWRGWWKVANQEQILTFYILGLLTLIGLSVLVNSTLGLSSNATSDISFVQREANVLGQQIAPWFEIFFYAAGFAVLLSTNIGVVDYVSRLTADSLKVSFLRESGFWSESKIYITVVWLMCLVGAAIIWTGIEPLALLVIAATGGGFAMFFYSALLMRLNSKHLPEPIKLRGWRMIFMALAFLLYAVFVLYIIYQMVTQGPASFA
ncbi:MAG TPA: Nramp family divalent metal transporter [Rubrobacter sp.]|nr:Nramp family divalent metal transporter [Rubrobacter sp.]